MVSKDYKQPPARRRAPPRGQPPPRPWRWFLGGTLCGAVLVGIAVNPQILPARVRGAATDARKAVVDTVKGNDPASKPPPTRFEFYSLLPEMEVAVPEEELHQPPSQAADAKAKADAGAPSAPVAGASYMLQVASFRRAADADRLRAELALLGMEAQIQTVTIDGQQTWHRVRVGPFDGLAALNAARARLESSGYHSLALRIRG